MLYYATMLKHGVRSKIGCINTTIHRGVLSHFLPRRDITKQEVLHQMEIRHQKRAKAKEHFKKQKFRKSD